MRWGENPFTVEMWYNIYPCCFNKRSKTNICLSKAEFLRFHSASTDSISNVRSISSFHVLWNRKKKKIVSLDFFQMATSTRQFGRRGPSNVVNGNVVSSDSGAPLSPSSTGSTSTPPRRYVLDVPTSRSSRLANQTNDESDEVNSRTRSSGATMTYSNVLTTEAEGIPLSRSDSREYYYGNSRDNMSSSNLTRYMDEASVEQLLQSDTRYSTTAIEDQEVQALTNQSRIDVKNYPINVDANPEMVVRPNTQRVTYTQDIAVRYLKPSTPPPPGVRIDSQWGETREGEEIIVLFSL